MNIQCGMVTTKLYWVRHVAKPASKVVEDTDQPLRAFRDSAQ